MKYSKKFEEDYKWFISIKEVFNFDGCGHYFNKKGVDIIQHDPNGLTAKECFYLFDSQGLIKPTKESDELHSLLKTKGSVNLHIKMYAQGRADGTLYEHELTQIAQEYNAPDWFIKAVEKQKHKYY